MWWWFLFFLGVWLLSLLSVHVLRQSIYLQINNITTTSATIGWDVVQGAVSYEYGIRIIGVTGWVYYTTTSNSFVFSGLSAGRQVRLRVKAICASDGSNTSPYSSTYIFNTPSAKLSADITNLNVYPNPAQSKVNIGFVSEEVQDILVKIVNSQGEQVFIDNKSSFIGEYTKAIELKSYAKDLYLQIVTNDRLLNERIIIQ